jgi:VWFA-related protein
MHMFRKLRWTALALATVFVAAGSVAAQEQPRFEERLDVREVLLDVVVTDARGNVIVGLGPEDFVVEEDGRPVALTGVTFYSNRKLVEGSEELAKKGVRIDEVPEDRYFILFFHDQRHAATEAPRLLSQQMEAARRAKGWIRGELSPNDWVAVASYDTRLKVHQDFTHDQRDLTAAVDAAMKGKDSGNWPSRQKEGADPSLLAHLPQGKELGRQSETVYEALQLLADASGEVRGRKNLLYFGTGLPGRFDSFGNYLPDERYWDPTMETLNDNNVAVYAIDLVPVGTEHPLSNSMNRLADDTGGRYFFNVVNFATPLDQIARENSGYYLLSYRGEHPTGETGFQEVKVETRNPEFRVKARRGYEYGEG